MASVFSLGDAIGRAEQIKGARQRRQLIGAQAEDLAAQRERDTQIASLSDAFLQGDQDAGRQLAAIDPQRATATREFREGGQPEQPAFSDIQDQAGTYLRLAEQTRRLDPGQRVQFVTQAVANLPDSPLKQTVLRGAQDGNLTDEEINVFEQSMRLVVDPDERDDFQKRVARIMEANPNASREDAMNAALRMFRTTTDPVFGGSQTFNVLDAAGGRAPQVGAQAGGQPSGQQSPQDLGARLAAEREVLFGQEGNRRLEEATGPLQQGPVRAANLAAGLVGAEPVDPDVEASARALDIIRRDLARQTATDSGNRLLVTIYKDALKDLPTAMDTDASGRQKFREVLRRLDDELVKIEEILGSDRAPPDQVRDAIEARADINLQRRRLIELVQGSPLAGDQPGGRRQTPGGVRYRVLDEPQPTQAGPSEAQQQNRGGQSGRRQQPNF